MKRFIFWMALFALSLFPQFSTYAANFAPGCTGTTGDASALQTAVTTANSNGVDDTITLVSGCTYTLTATLQINSDGGHLLTINGSGATISGNNTVRVLDINTSANVTLNNVTISNGNASGSYGGGISNAGGNLTITNSTISNNQADTDGGGIYNDDGLFNAVGIITVTNSTISNNEAGNRGGGIFNADSPSSGVTNNTINLTNSTVSGNEAGTNGGGIYNDQRGILNITRSTVSGNKAPNGSGGGLYDAGQTQPNVVTSTFAHNSAANGGGIASFGTANFTITSTTIANNTAAGAGGGIINNNGNPDVGNPQLHFGSTIVANNTAPTGPDIAGLIESQNYNLIGTTIGANISGTTNHNKTVNPLLDTAGLQNNGGPTQTIALQANSPAIDAGSCTAGNDQRGVARPVDFFAFPNPGNGCDIGAYEKENDPPVANPDAYQTSFQTTLNVAPPGILGNDSDPNSDPLTAVVVQNAAHGTLMLNANGAFAYTPNAGFAGFDTFTYKANDGKADSNTATVTIEVRNLAPVAHNDFYAATTNQQLSIAAPGVLGNDTDAENNPLTAVLVTGTSSGTLSLGASGGFIYTPSSGFVGNDSFTYRASDGSSNSNVATVTINVATVRPTANPDEYDTPADTPLTVLAPGVLGNDSHPGGAPLTATLVTNVQYGTLTFNGNGGFTYTPSTGYSGTDSFTYVASDGAAASSPAAVSIFVGSQIAPKPTSLSIEGSLTTVPIMLTYKWRHQTVAGQTSVPGEWYNLYITQGSAVILDAWFPVQQVCIRLRCEVTPGYDLLPAGLLNGIYNWKVRAYFNGVIGQWSETKTFTVNVPRPQLPQGFTVTTNEGRPGIQINNDPGTAWYQIYVGSVSGQLVSLEWIRKTPEMCTPLRCTFDLNAHAFNGNFVVYMQAWGPAGFSVGGFQGWGGPETFALSFAPPDVVTGLSAEFTSSGRPLFAWDAMARTTWYNLEIRQPTGELVYHLWFAALDLGCALPGGRCNVVPNVVLENGRSYTWRLRTWGPGGFSGGTTDGTWASGAGFTVNAPAPGRPTTTAPDGMIETPAPVYTWQHIENASWYQVEIVTSPSRQVVHSEWYPVEALGCRAANVCALAVDDLYLANGGYAWSARAYTPGGLGLWSIDRLFTVSRP